MRTFMTVVVTSVALALISVAAVRAAEKKHVNADAEFLTKVVPGTAASVKVIEYAEKHASDPEVREFAREVAKQHKWFVKTATEHARRLKITVVTDPNKDSKATINQLSKLNGTELDVAFLQWLSDSHKETAVFDSEVKGGTDADLKTFANNAISSGHEHLHGARAILARIKK